MNKCCGFAVAIAALLMVAACGKEEASSDKPSPKITADTSWKFPNGKEEGKLADKPAPAVPAPAPTAAPSPAAAPPPVAALVVGASGVKVHEVAVHDLPKGIDTKKGSVVKAVNWTDKNGANYVVFTRKLGDAESSLSMGYLFVDHYVEVEHKLRKLRSVRDGEDDCEFDLTVEFVDEALSVTDLDGDSIGEITFAYRVACRSDVSPAALKLLILENGDKYIIRGESRFPDDAPDPATRKIDKSLNNGPRQFRSHATTVWEQIEVEEI